MNWTHSITWVEVSVQACVINLSSLISFDVLDLRTQKGERSELDSFNNTDRMGSVINLSSLDGLVLMFWI